MKKVKILREIKNNLINVSSSINQSINTIKHNTSDNSVYVYWYHWNHNFGDQLNPLLLKYYGLLPIRHNRISAEVLAIGSILDEIHEDYAGYIIGSGLMFGEKKVLNKSRILAVRGSLTRDFINASLSTPLGDPGILIRKIYPHNQKKEYMLGLVPHHFDKQNLRIRKIKYHYPDDVTIIDVQQKPLNVIKQIDKCAYILSSSLHGIVTADALGISSGWLQLSEKVEGKGFKFFDYSSAFNQQLQPHEVTGDERLSVLIKMTRKVSDDIYRVQDELDLAFQRLVAEVINNPRVHHSQ